MFRDDKHSVTHKQRGVATLVVVISLIIIMAVMALTVANSGIMDQRTTGSDIRAREAHEAAEAGLEYAVAWANSIRIPDVPVLPGVPGSTQLTCDGGTDDPYGCPPSLTTITGSTTNETYQYTLTYTVTTGAGTKLVRIESDAYSTADASTVAHAEVYLQQVPLGQGSPETTPVVVDGAFGDEIVGGGDILTITSTSTAIASSAGADEINEGHLEQRIWTDLDGDGEVDNMEIKVKVEPFKKGDFDCSSYSSHCAWNHTFQGELPFEDAVEYATAAGNVFTNDMPCGPPDPSKPAIYILKNTGPIGSADLSNPGCKDSKIIGSLTAPVAIIVPESYGCPPFSGGLSIYGYFYIENETACDASGWGGAKVYGSAIFEGPVTKLTSGTEFIEMDWGDSVGNTLNLPVDYANAIPGTWRDYE
ncbi:pilus assembly PilX family protein [Marinobacterium sediminicola]|uniref:Tfp pilus assembly protein PilX n=1 Tax=Marinobacterium sediminicola TaxID=518898 RepID=A0ABY1S3F1_9GAMM|nr:PilX N-terminal domain-containing pilus assembly protein [Marinobacterium sediminicola]ULG68232.1 hypothetical protein LN244_11025 [Marinobacterium sediminicola]SMR77799.1 Tfp pilus assembly protein PilX [Marinobacterium sediminicola]